MPVYAKCIEANPIIVGGATVAQGTGAPANYHDANRAYVISSGDSLESFLNLEGRFLQGGFDGDIAVASTDDVRVSHPNSGAIITYPASTGRANIISGLDWSYSAAPSSGHVLITNSDGYTIFAQEVAPARMGTVLFDPEKRGEINSLMKIELTAGGSGVMGTLSIKSHRWG